MKLSEMNVKQMAGALCRLTAPMGSIAKDESLNGLFAMIDKTAKERAHMTAFGKMGMLLDAVPILLETHYEDTILIVSVMLGKGEAEVEMMNGMDMIDEMMKSIDEQFMRFFKSSAVTEKTSTVKGE